MPSSAAISVEDPVLEISGLCVTGITDDGPATLVSDVSLTLERGKITGLAGESGSGKTLTALSAMQLLHGTGLKITRGSIRLDGAELRGQPESALRRVRGAQISMVFQEPMASLDPSFTIGSLLAETLMSHHKISRKAALAQAVDLLTSVGIPNPADRLGNYPFEFSGGMMQRVLIAMAVACRPSVVIADEPTTALDVTVQAQILDLLRGLAEEGMAVLLVTHDLALMSEYADSLVVMYAGQVIETGTTAEVLAHPQHPYTAGLIASVPSVTKRADRLHNIGGQVPLPGSMPPGCRFAPRCEFRSEACDQPVELRHRAGGQVRCVHADEVSLPGVGAT